MSFAVRPKTIEYVLKADRNEPSPPVFLLKTLSVADQDRIADLEKWERNEKGEIAGLANPNEITTETLRCGLTGWKNFCYDDGSGCMFDQSDFDKNLLALDPMVRFELRVEIKNLSYATETELKNSASPLSGKSVTTKKSAKRAK